MTSDINQVQTGVNMTLRLLLRSPFVVIGAMVMAFAVDTQVALLFALLIPLLGLVVWIIMSVTLPGHREVQNRLDLVLRRTRETLKGVRVIRAFAKEENEIESFGEEHHQLTLLQRRVGRTSALLNPLTYVMVNGGLIGLLWSGGLRMEAGLLTQGAVIALVNYLSQILVELIKFANLILTITKALACAARIEQVLDVPPPAEDTPLPVIPALGNEAVCFDSVSMRYDGAGGNALTGLSFTVQNGQTVGIIGGTGSGKSSLVNLIPRFYEPSEGEVLVQGINVKEQNLSFLRGKIAVVPQRATLFSGSIRDNLKWGNGQATDEELWRALHLAQAAPFVRAKKEGLDGRIEQNGQNLSGGQRQRLAIARALVKNAAILILDDSFSALDYATDASLRQSLRALSGTTTVFIVSQRVSTIRLADVILVLESGSLAGCGTHAELLETCPVYQEIVRSQHPQETLA